MNSKISKTQLFLVIVLTIVFFAGGERARDITRELAKYMLGGMIVVTLVMIFMLRKVIVPYLGVRFGKTNFIIKDKNNVCSGKCPKCKEKVVYGELESGELAFSCQNCGEKAHWQ